MLGIMAGMDQEAWFAGFDVVPRAVLLLVSQAPDARHHGRLGPQDSVEVHRCSSWTRFSPCPLLCYVCLGPDSVLHSLVFPQLQFITVVDVAFALCSLSLSAGPCCQASCTAWTIPGSALFSPVVVQRQVPFTSGQCAALPVETL